jgi:hypothetical protein
VFPTTLGLPKATVSLGGVKFGRCSLALAAVLEVGIDGARARVAPELVWLIRGGAEVVGEPRICAEAMTFGWRC